VRCSCGDRAHSKFERKACRAQLTYESCVFFSLPALTFVITLAPQYRIRKTIANLKQ
jgi:hypothetical protein